MAKRKSIAAHHAEWLGLIETSGPFLSLPVLVDVFPNGLDAPDADKMREFRAAYEAWQNGNGDADLHRAWIDVILTRLLDHDENFLTSFAEAAPPKSLVHRVEQHGETLRPDLMLHDVPEGSGDGTPRMLVVIHPANQRLDRAVKGSRWNASPSSRCAELCRATGVRLGLVTNGEQWTLVDAPKDETVGYANWYSQLWIDEPITFRAFETLLGQNRFFAVGDKETPEGLLTRSRENQQEVTDQLGLQVRRAVEVLVRSIDRADQDLGDVLLKDIDDRELYEAAVTLMMRLVFLFSAEERGLLLLGDPLFDQHYAVSTLCDQLRATADQHGEEVLERRFDAWCRLLSAFRTVFAGVRHDRLNIRPYGGALFDPDRFPFLEGRQHGTSWRTDVAEPLPIDNRTVLHILESLQFLQTRIGSHTESRRLSFRALGIEQIGHVYEGLLDHWAIRAKEPVLGLYGRAGDEPEIALSELEAQDARGRAALVEYLAKRKVKSSKTAVEKLLDAKLDDDRAARIRAACRSDELWECVKPLAGLVRDDDFEHPIVIGQGRAYVTAGADRRSTGTHYTPPELTEPIVRYTLEPLVYVGPANGKPESEWQLKSAKEILDLRICDMACGSGAFLVQACRYLADRLLEAWAKAERELRAPDAEEGDTPLITQEAARATGVLSAATVVPRDPDERLLLARRLVSQRCLYGVDKNHLAVEMAKLSLWLLTLSKDRPFTFLDHAIRRGDSLVGLSARQIAAFHWDEAHEPEFEAMFIRERIERAAEYRRNILTAPDNIPLAQKEQMLAIAEESLDFVRLIGDLVIAAYFTSEDVGADLKRDELLAGLREYREKFDMALREPLAEAVAKLRGGEHPLPPFHWQIEFPEVFGRERGGFDAFVGNPPFMGGQKITGHLGSIYREWCVEQLANGKRGSADLCAYFFLRAISCLGDGGHCGLLATNTVSEGDTREVGLDQLLSQGCVITRADRSRKWPGTANLEVAQLWLRSGTWDGTPILNGGAVQTITSLLRESDVLAQPPKRLDANHGLAYQGSTILGLGFTMPPEDAQQLIAKDPRNRVVLFPYLTGDDLNSRPDQVPSRWVINFFDWPLERSASGSWLKADDKLRRTWLRSGRVPSDYPAPVAADFPDCLTIVETRVKPQRASNRDRRRREIWWQFTRPTLDLYDALRDAPHALVASRVSKYVMHATVPTQMVFDVGTNVVLYSSHRFGILSSSLFRAWVRQYGSSLRTDVRYTVTDCFETFPFPPQSDPVVAIGREYDASRRHAMTQRGIGLTAFYNLVNNRLCRDDDIDSFRELQRRLDDCTLNAYGWGDVVLSHDYRDTYRGLRFTIGPEARQEVLARLLQLNYARYADEVAAGLHDKKKGKRKGSGRRTSRSGTKRNEHEQPSLFSNDGDEPADTPAPARSTNRTTEELEYDELIQGIRSAAQSNGEVSRDEFITAVARELGFARTGSKIHDAIDGAIRAAARRGIVETGPGTVAAARTRIDDWTRDELVEALGSVMRRGAEYDRDEAIKLAASHLGFRRVGKNIYTAFRSAINGAIRRGILGYKGDMIWRED